MTETEECKAYIKQRDAQLDKVLNDSSVIWEIGGYLGDWVEMAADRWKSHIFVFEPVESYYNKLVERFKNRGHVFLINRGISTKDEIITLNVRDDAASVFNIKEPMGSVRAFAYDIKTCVVSRIDFLQLNAEGIEYDVLEDLLKYPQILKRIQRLRIQFHRIEGIIDAANRRDKIREGLAKNGYKNVFTVPFIWEEWEL